MRKTMLLLTVLEFTGSLWAVDPTVGTWKMNVAKSIFRADEIVKKQATIVA
jgi:hypothetical protein